MAPRRLSAIFRRNDDNVFLSKRLDKSCATIRIGRPAQPVGVISVADHIRPSAKDGIQDLQSMGIKRLGILSGDHDKSAHLVAQNVGMTEVWSQMKPQDKLQVIGDFQVTGNVVVFVGVGSTMRPRWRRLT